jgi:Protein of unknown function (DUF2778)
LLRAKAFSVFAAILVGILISAFKVAGAHLLAIDHLSEIVRGPRLTASSFSSGPGDRISSFEGDAARKGAAVDSIFKESSNVDSFQLRFTAISSISRLVVETKPILARLASADANDAELAVLTPPATGSAVTSSSPGKGLAFRARRRLALASLGESASSNSGQEQDSAKIDQRTAIYDISAHALHLPDGRTLEAHSGLGPYLDDTRYISVRAKGPTPPNVYRLVLRERLFHGVRAIRLIPVGAGNMFGRDGMLVHTYMLGPNGQSNGCISLAEYPEFLRAFLKGDIDRLVVVQHLDEPSGSSKEAGWFTKVRDFLNPFGA